MIEILNGKRTVIFDLDETLIFTPDEILIKRVKETCRRASLPLPDDKAILDFYVNHNWDNTIRSWGFNEVQFKKFWNTYIDYVENRETDSTRIYDDVQPTLSALRDKRIKIAVITSATEKYSQRQIQKIGDNFFTYWVSVGHHINSIAQKPSPEGIHYILSRIDENIENVASIGDSDLDTQMAKNAGCLDILIDRGNFKGLIKPTIKIKSLTELV